MLPNPLLHFLFCFDSSFLRLTSALLIPSPAYFYSTKKKELHRPSIDFLLVQGLTKSSDVKCLLQYWHWNIVDLFIFTIQTERRLSKFHGNPWNDRSFRLAELFWQSLVQQNRRVVAYFSLNNNTNVLVLVVVVPNSSHVTLVPELAEFVYCFPRKIKWS